MNLFVLSNSKRRIARYMVDKHIAKMILESVQMLSTTKRILDPHSHLGPVYHKSYIVAQFLRENPPPLEAFEFDKMTPFALAMPDIYKTDDAIESYRAYYRTKPASWKNREKPYWF
jgi:hypothetical protein